MMITIESALFGSLVTVGIFIIAGVVRLSNTMVKIQTTVEFIREKVDTLALNVETFNEKFFTREEAARELTKTNSEHAGFWKRIDEGRNNIEKLEREVAAIRGKV